MIAVRWRASVGLMLETRFGGFFSAPVQSGKAHQGSSAKPRYADLLDLHDRFA